MGFITKEWKNRIYEFAGRRKLKNVLTGEEIVYDVTRAEGAETQAGDAFDAAGMNALEQRISDAFTEANTITKGTLSIGATNITIYDERITTNSVIDPYTSIYGVSPLTASIATGSITFTFVAQKVAMTVGVGVRN